MLIRAARIISVISLAVAAAGVGGYVVSSAPRSWSDLTEVFLWYARQYERSGPLVLGLALLAALLALAFLIIGLRRDARWRKTVRQHVRREASNGGPAGDRTLPSRSERLVRPRARRTGDRWSWTDPREDPSGESEIAPLQSSRPERPLRGVEAWLRLGAALALASVVVVIHSQGLVWGFDSVVHGTQHAPWRELTLTVTSEPSRAAVRVQGQVRGVTPLEIRVPCQGQQLEILVEASGYFAWQWNGICPRAEDLRLEARLRPQR